MSKRLGRALAQVCVEIGIKKDVVDNVLFLIHILIEGRNESKELGSRQNRTLLMSTPSDAALVYLFEGIDDYIKIPPLAHKDMNLPNNYRVI